MERFNKWMKEISFTINEKLHTVSADNGITPETTLNAYIRDYAKLKGTKNMCLEGGCGSCIVSVRSKHPVTNMDIYYAVNSCLVSIFSCAGWHITTVEGIGNRKDGYNVIQTRLADFNATQCGFCSPGMVMNMYSLWQAEGNINMTMKGVENSFGGNICRCTGYRPIADAFKSMCTDADPSLTIKCMDLEDIAEKGKCWRSGKNCSENVDGNCTTGECKESEPQLVGISIGNAKWMKVFKVAQILEIFNQMPQAKYMLVAGNTGHGVYRRPDNIEVFIDITSVAELQEFKIDQTQLVLGGNMTLTETMKVFRKIGNERNNFKYLIEIADHIDVIANVPVRNIGTLAGNLFMKHEHHEFPSDVFVTLETFGAKLVIVSRSREKTVTLQEFLELDMTTKIIRNIILPQLEGENIHRTYKIMPREQNAHAYVNAGFCIKLTDSNVTEASIVYGGINPQFVHAENSEKYLIGKHIYDNTVLQGLYIALQLELKPDHVLPDATPDFRKNLAIALFYKFILSVAPKDKINPRNLSGGQKFDRPVSSACQDFETDKSKWPLQKPVPKIEALSQCSGEAIYINDIFYSDDDLHASFVLARAVPGSTIVGENPAEALNIPGVVKYINHKDIPGRNLFSIEELGMDQDEEIFCDGKVRYNGQPVGLIVAKTRDIAIKAAKIVEITYEAPSTKPVFDMREVIVNKDPQRMRLEKTIEATSKGNNIQKVISGKFDIGHQYHYTMETQSCFCVPSEDSLDVYPSTQFLSATHIAISKAIGVPVHKINIQIRRLGGAYGAKISRSQQISTACAVAAHVLNRPVHLQMTMEDNMDAIGKRFPLSGDYEVGVDNNGKIQYLKSCFYQNYGVTTNEAIAPASADHMLNCYATDKWEVKAYGVFTDIPVNTFCRAPSSTEGIGYIESIMDHIAHELNVDPLQVRQENVRAGHPITKLIDEFRKSADFDDRKKKVDEFNKNNRWRKKGIHMALMDYPFFYFGNYTVLVSIYTPDGTVAVTHGGIESGQGINTKVAQVAAYILGIEMEMVSIKPASSLTAPNNESTGGSVTSEAVCYAVIQACKKLRERIDPYREKDMSWEDLIKTVTKEKIDLCATYMFTTRDKVKSYPIYGLGISEVEVDILTGLHQILRVDILEDTGESMSPEIDIGQIEGAFVMGMGYWLSEKIVLDPETGAMLTNRTWTYKTPGMKDIPIDFRVNFMKNAPNPDGVLNSKATAEPPLCLSVGVVLAIRNAVASARLDSKSTAATWYPIDGPSTTEDIFVNSLVKYQDFVL